MTKILSNKDFQKNQIQNAVVHNLSSAPGSPVQGQIYYDTTTFKLYYYNNTTWIDASGGGIPLTLIDAKGDLIVGTADNVAARQGVGANGTFLVANSGVTNGINWRVIAAADIQELIATSDLTDWPRVAALDLNSQKITSLAAGTAATDAASLSNRLDQFAIPTADLNINSHKLTNVTDGTAAQDAATFGQLNAIIEGKSWKEFPGQAATTGVLPNSPTYSAGAGTLTAGSNTTLAAQDGITLVLNDSLLVKNQASSFQDGIYTLTQLGSGAAPWVLTRRADASVFSELQSSATIYLAGGVTQGGDIYTQTATLTNLTSDTQTWTKTGDTNTVYTADGTTITLTGTQFALTALGITNAYVSTSAAIAYSKLNLATSIVNGDISTSAAIAYSKLNLTGLVVNADISASAAIAYSKLNLTGLIVNADIASGAAIVYSKLSLAGGLLAADVNGTAVASGSGTVRVSRTYAQAITGGATSEVITHGLGTRDVSVSLVNNSTPWDSVDVTWEATSTSTITLRSDAANLPASYRAVVTG